MKQLVVVIIALCISFQMNAQSQEIENFIAKYKDQDDFTSIFISSKMFSMISSIESDDEETDEILDIIDDLHGLKIVTSDSNPLKLFNEAKSIVSNKPYELLMEVDDSEDDVFFYVKDKPGKRDSIDELIMLVGGKDNFVMLSFQGSMSLNSIGKLASGLDIDGAEHLENLDKN